jgi:hypothetical protein
MTSKLQIRKVWSDQDVCELEVIASDGQFAGTTRVYADRDEPRGLANALDGFPRDSADCREYVLGAFGPNSAGGGIAIRFFCADLAGHAITDIQIEDSREVAGILRTVQLALTFEAAAMDRFILGLRIVSEGGTATLWNREVD